MDQDLESIQEARRLVEAAHDAWLKFEDFTEEQVERILLEISRAGIANAEAVARIVVDETGYGTVEHKTLKNLFCADDVYRATRPMKTVGIVKEDKGKKVFEVASSIGVIAAIIPSTNPTSTTIYKALIALKGRNTIVFSPHPSAVRSIGETSRIIAEAAERAGAPKNVVTCMKLPTMEGTQELMKHPLTSLILATGGTGLVKAAYSAGKPAFGVGPGNVPSYIEKTADVAKAVRDILTGKCFDNGTLCSSEQAIICDEIIKDTVLDELKKQGAHVCTAQEKTQLERTIQTPRRTLNTTIVGKSAAKIAEIAGFTVPSNTRALVAYADGVGPDYPISMEKLSPVLALYVVKDWHDGCAKCIEILNFGGLGHTLSVHTKDEEVVRQFGLRKPAFRICVNTPAALGAVGYTTNLFPSMTLGCGAAGGNITSDNISPLHLINLKRVAYGVRDVPAIARPPVKTVTALAAAAGGRAAIEEIVDRWLGSRTTAPRPAAGVPAPASAPPLSSYTQLEPSRPQPEKREPKPVGFVCEEDVRAAVLANSKIVIGKKTIITPSAREIAEANDVFVLDE
ncbi:MAG: acetaldehyde dehydrogenase (acetylating) [Acidobacteria bacterium]|nr:MAG: acetaldehyde dehydrogenase (acetylating) [Acidobacteriota bacterium]